MREGALPLVSPWQSGELTTLPGAGGPEGLQVVKFCRWWARGDLSHVDTPTTLGLLQLLGKPLSFASEPPFYLSQQIYHPEMHTHSP